MIEDSGIRVEVYMNGSKAFGAGVYDPKDAASLMMAVIEWLEFKTGRKND